ncbi:MAG: hypothetical protein JWO38_6128 [Gemmataceae bacterium]|nr:hypothetical protein [Gemmataceae bacterium]
MVGAKRKAAARGVPLPGQLPAATPPAPGSQPPPADPDAAALDPLNYPPKVRAKVEQEAARVRAHDPGDAIEPAPAKPAPAVPARPLVVSRSFDAIEAQEVNWLWPDRIPFGMLSVLDGDPNLGKSLIAIDTAARTSTGRPFPFSRNPGYDPASVLFLASEDSAEHTIKPRLVAAGADVRLCRLAESIRLGDHERPIRLPDDIEALEREVLAHGVGLLVIDPFLGFLSQAIDSHKDQSVRDVLHRMKQLAERTGAAVLALRHLNKGAAGSALYRGMGSIAITAAARSALTVGAHPTEEGSRVLATTKCNITKLPRSIVYRVEEEAGRPVIRWIQETDITADELGVKIGKDNDGAKVEAVDFLRDLLGSGPVPATHAQKQATAAGITFSTLRRAKESLGVRARKAGYADSSWVWELPPTARPEDAHANVGEIPA